MRVGMTVVFQNPHDVQSDHAVYADELRLADLAEPLGYDSIWGVEHHFTDYTMCPDVLQFLSYMAGRTERINLGSMVVVLPWRDPLRVAEQVAMLDAMSGGRLILGLGRGAAKVEFDGFRLPMDESRPRFVESASMLLRGLESGFCEHTGDFVSQPRARIRPAPFKSFRGRTYAAAVSPESARIMAELGVGILIIPQKPWHEVAKELDAYRAMYREVNAAEAPAPILDIRERVSNQAFVGVFSYAGMPYDEAERNMRLFAREVTPELKKLGGAAVAARTIGERERPQADIALGF